MKQLYFILLIIIATTTIKAQNVVSDELAKHVALQCMIQKSYQLSNGNISFLYEKIHEIITVKNQENLSLFHIVNFDPSGWVIVSATKTYHPVIAFSTEGNFMYPVTAPAVSMWLQNESNKILRSVKSGSVFNQISNEWLLYENSGMPLYRGGNEKQVLPMLTTQWNQGIYYNELCPVDAAGPDGKTYAGCVATAIGQVMNYFRYPLSGTGTYTSEYLVYGIHSVNYGNAHYNWNEMPLKVTRSNHPVAELLYHIGVSVDMNYGPDGSGMWNHKAAHTMKTFFGYTDSTQYNFRDTTTIDWNGMLIDHLDRGIVLYYAGWADSQYVSGHAFVCDGYQDSTFFHFNWGWGGAYDGYFNIDNLIVGGSDFTTMHEAVINATPATNYPYYCSGTDTMRSLDGTIEDGSGPVYNYNENTFCSWLIMPDDTVSSISLEFVKCNLSGPGDVVRIYRGTNATGTLIGTYTGTGTTSPINITGRSAFVVFESDGTNNSGGFLISYKATQVKTCTGITTLTSTSGTITDGSGLYTYQNSNLCRWKIEPPGAQIINISFSDFDIDSTDYVRITDITANTVVATLKGSQIPQALSIPTDKVQVLFFSNATGNGEGFTLHYECSLQSVDEMMKSKINVYPNPVSGLLTVSFNEWIPFETAVITLRSVSGQVVDSFETVINSKELQYDISHVNDGFYILNISDGNGHSVNKKVIVSGNR